MQFHSSDTLLRLSIKMGGRGCQDLVSWGVGGGERLHPPVIDVRHLGRHKARRCIDCPVYEGVPSLRCRVSSDIRRVAAESLAAQQQTGVSYRGADKSLARPGRKQARKHVRDARDSTTSRRELSSSFFLQGKAPEEINAILTETLTCFLPGRAKDLSAPL